VTAAAQPDPAAAQASLKQASVTLRAVIAAWPEGRPCQPAADAARWGDSRPLAARDTWRMAWMGLRHQARRCRGRPSRGSGTSSVIGALSMVASVAIHLAGYGRTTRFGAMLPISDPAGPAASPTEEEHSMTVTYPTMTLHRRSSHLSRWRCANAEELAVQAEHSVAGAEAADELECILREQGISPGRQSRRRSDPAAPRRRSVGDRPQPRR